eukprot:scaffold1.g5409.t1
MASLAACKPVVARPAAVFSAKPRPRPMRLQPIYSAPNKEAIEAAIKEAEEACAGGDTGECATAWDTVEELSAAAAHAKVTDESQGADGSLTKLCEEDPSLDECRVYDGKWLRRRGGGRAAHVGALPGQAAGSPRLLLC